MSRPQQGRVGRIVDSVMNPVLGAVDMDAVLEHVDMNSLLARVDMNAMLARVDMNALLERVDIDALIQRVDVDALIKRVDVDGLIQRVDVDGLIQRVDVDGLIQRVDVSGLVGRVRIGNVVTDSATTVATSALDMIRQQLAGADALTDRAVKRVIHKREPFDPELGGRPAGAWSRLVALVLDGVFISTLFAIGVAATTYLVNLVLNRNFDPSDDGGGFWWIASGVAFAGFYFWVSLTLAGRTLGMGLLGVRVRRTDGRRLGPGHAFLRVLAFPFSFILGLGLIPIVTSRQRRALHDYVADTIVVHDWGGRPAQLHGSMTRWFTPKESAVPASDASLPS
jgi:uncharacterized RDD family membrane protein YckC